jgi:hypothetical protein
MATRKFETYTALRWRVWADVPSRPRIESGLSSRQPGRASNGALHGCVALSDMAVGPAAPLHIRACTSWRLRRASDAARPSVAWWIESQLVHVKQAGSAKASDVSRETMRSLCGLCGRASVLRLWSVPAAPEPGRLCEGIGCFT